jgi:tRNA nucleotidyltransferase (CCA-adding enzyme)
VISCVKHRTRKQKEIDVLNKLMTPQTQKLGDAFVAAGFEIRFVGGCVRDALLGVAAKDVDFCTDATPDEMKALAQANKWGFIATGIEHGTATLVVDKEPFEVTTLRVDVETDGRHAEVEFTRDFEKDAERRDLTINAMSMDFDGNVYDYFGGRDDLAARKVRFVGIAEMRIREDYLRILRYFRFAARFDADMDQDTLDIFAQPEILDNLNLVSVERFWMEMSKILDPKMPGRLRVVEAMFKTRVNRALGVFRFNPADLLRSDDAVSALSTLIHPSDETKFFQFWKISSAEEAKVRNLVRNRMMIMDEVHVEVALTRDEFPRDHIVSLCEIAGEPTLAQYARDFVIPTFPVTGKDLIASGMKPGPQMGQRLRVLKNAWTYSRFTKSKDELMEIAQ